VRSDRGEAYFRSSADRPPRCAYGDVLARAHGYELGGNLHKRCRTFRAQRVGDPKRPSPLVAKPRRLSDHRPGDRNPSRTGGIGYHSLRTARHGDCGGIPRRPADESGRVRVLGSCALGNRRRCKAVDLLGVPQGRVRTHVPPVSIGPLCATSAFRYGGVVSVVSKASASGV
jgi:hypothetical protein